MKMRRCGFGVPLVATLESAAVVAEGRLGPLYGWLPSWRWTEEMDARLREAS